MKTIRSLAICAAVVGLAGPVMATPIELIENGTFDAGLTGWNTSGDVRTTDAGPLAPFAAAQGMDGSFALLGLEATEGRSKLRQDIDVSLFEEITVSFNWAFDYWDNSRTADDTFLSFIRQDGTPALKITMLDLETHGTGFFSPDLGLAHGYFEQTYDISAYTTDEARLIFRLDEEADDFCLTGTASVVGIDNVSVTGESENAPVPEPATMLLFGTGLAGLAGVGRKRINKK